MVIRAASGQRANILLARQPKYCLDTCYAEAEAESGLDVGWRVRKSRGCQGWGWLARLKVMKMRDATAVDR